MLADFLMSSIFLPYEVLNIDITIIYMYCYYEFISPEYLVSTHSSVSFLDIFTFCSVLRMGNCFNQKSWWAKANISFFKNLAKFPHNSEIILLPFDRFKFSKKKCVKSYTMLKSLACLLFSLLKFVLRFSARWCKYFNRFLTSTWVISTDHDTTHLQNTMYYHQKIYVWTVYKDKPFCLIFLVCRVATLNRKSGSSWVELSFLVTSNFDRRWKFPLWNRGYERKYLHFMNFVS